MADKSVIQMSEAQHRQINVVAAGTAADHMVLRSSVPISDDERQDFVYGFAKGWEMATKAILRDGNCRFEAGEE